MPTVKEEQFSFGGIDSRSNPSNYPPDRAIRCINVCPQESGALRLRPGYTLPNGYVAEAAIHSAIYYEQFAATYLGPQYVLHGHGTAIKNYSLNTGVEASIGTFTTSNPWGHFRSGNRIFFSDGVTNYNWDGSTLRVTGLPALATTPFASGLLSPFASTCTGTWTNAGNATGPPDGSYASALSSTVTLHTPVLTATGFGLSVPTGANILTMQVFVTAHVTDPGKPTDQHLLDVQWTVGGAGVGGFPYAEYTAYAADTDPIIGEGAIPPNYGTFGGLTAAIVNDPTFGVNVIGNGIFGSSTPAQWFIDSIQIAIQYASANDGVVTVTSSSLGSIAPTVLSGYQLFAAIYNPITQHMGNCVPIGGRNTVGSGSTASVFVVTGLPALSALNLEWEYALGMTNDGGQVPYWFVDPQGNNIVLGNSATMGTVYIGNVDALQELPFRNDAPPPFDKYAAVGTRIFAGLSGDPFLHYSNDPSDISNANYVGQPAESWPGDQQEPLPDGLLPRSIHAYRLEGWFFSRENLHIWSQFLLQQGVNPWRGPWPGGCAGQRAFIETPHGPFWVSAQKQLCTFMEDGVISVSAEYELALLGQFADATLGETEVGYLLDQEALIDQIVIRGWDNNGNPVVVVHDFNLKDERGPHGQGYQYQYGGLTINTFVGAGYTPRQNVYDTNGKQRLWVGAAEGFLAQIEDGVSDNGTTYAGDYIGLIGLGKQRRTLVELEFQGDPNWAMSYLADYSLGLGDFTPTTNEIIPDYGVQTPTRLAAKFGQEEARWAYVRLQITSDPTASFAVSDPPFLPLPSYGVINETVLKLGAPRPEGR